ncbi:helix-turn-helix transcriptional regulator [Persicobacter diffluens]|uniref:AraC family transcriptional regulator n=1 Tax=Persicobacter diffluens TaxID=981 RepID=A0AAN4W2P9_9BACT|nr:AraC family transcriptional regulator [Persicobacter diffluens]
MSEGIIHIKSISELHQIIHYAPAKHPLITILDPSQVEITKEMVGQKFMYDMYYIGLKDRRCGMRYGRKHYDFADGVLVFTAPQQVMAATVEMGKVAGESGWMLVFHPDLIRKYPLGQNITKYNFFHYDNHEALHLSDQERKTLTDCVTKIQEEIDGRIDAHSEQVLVNNLDLMLSYCSRYYDRQFNTRAAENSDVVSSVEHILNDYFEQEKIAELGQPTIQYCAEQVNLSPNYLSDLLKKETGRTAKDHINDFIIEKAKTMLLNSRDSISGIAYTLGFNYPHYFSRLFKSKTGMTPAHYRDGGLI